MAPDQQMIRVSLAGLNLGTAEGRAEAQDRITRAAHRLCAGFDDERRVDHREAYAGCLRDSRAAALQQLERRRIEAMASNAPAMPKDH
jgi:UrcA family protein